MRSGTGIQKPTVEPGMTPKARSHVNKKLHAILRILKNRGEGQRIRKLLLWLSLSVTRLLKLQGYPSKKFWFGTSSNSKNLL
jgi:hypothetical protein